MRVHIILSFIEVFHAKNQPGAITQERETVNRSNYFHWLTLWRVLIDFSVIIAHHVNTHGEHGPSDVWSGATRLDTNN